MNNLQKLLKLRGLTVKQISDRIGYGYHNVQKIIKRVTRPIKKGGTVFSNREIEKAVAAILGLTHEQCWGSDAETILKRLIKQEITAKASQAADRLRQTYL